MAIHKIGPYEIQVVRYEAFCTDDPRALITVYERKAFLGKATVPVNGLDVAGMKKQALCLRNCEDARLKAVVEDARKVAGAGAAKYPAGLQPRAPTEKMDTC